MKKKILGVIMVTLMLTMGFAIAGMASETKELAPGVEYKVRRDLANLSGERLAVHIITVDSSVRDIEVKPVNAGNRIGDTETLSSMAGKYGAVAAINGGFYGNQQGRRLPIGNLLLEGQLLSQSHYNRTSMGISGANEVMFGFFNPVTRVIMPGGELVEVTAVNTFGGERGVYFYTGEWNGTVSGGERLNLVLEQRDGQNYKIAQITSGTVTVKPGQAVLSFRGEQRDLGNNLHVGALLRKDVQYNADFWSRAEHLLTAGPLLVDKGEPVFQAIDEGFTGSVLQPNPRSAIGKTADGKLLMVVAESHNGGSGRVGLTLEEMALLMAQLGAVEAMGLDSGGSSTLWAGDKVVNRVANYQRSIPNAILVLVGPKLYMNGERIYPDVPPVISEGRTLVPLRIMMEELGAQVDWDGATRTVTVTRENQNIKLQLNNNKAQVDGKEYVLDVPAQLVDGRTMIPVRFVTEALNGQVNWNAEQRKIELFLR
ncbi:hypothetical protein GGQ84_000682 [Desulfitispora alkaliphila]|uniref:stalk domain-containing protein n=1 Tax=Desulfitispora alkaliphila TaxID=622674 RepID=UPI003D226BA8